MSSLHRSLRGRANWISRWLQNRPSRGRPHRLRGLMPRVLELEGRVTPATISAAVVAGNLNITDSAGVVNDLTIRFDGTSYVITDATEQFISAPPGGSLSNGNMTLTEPASSFSGKISFFCNAGSDTLTVNWSTGNFVNSVNYNGGAGVSDQLVIKGGTFSSVTANYTNVNDGLSLIHI